MLMFMALTRQKADSIRTLLLKKIRLQSTKPNERENERERKR